MPENAETFASKSSCSAVDTRTHSMSLRHAVFSAGQTWTDGGAGATSHVHLQSLASSTPYVAEHIERPPLLTKHRPGPHGPDAVVETVGRWSKFHAPWYVLQEEAPAADSAVFMSASEWTPHSPSAHVPPAAEHVTVHDCEPDEVGFCSTHNSDCP